MTGSRRNFLAAGLALPAVASATRSEQAPQTPARPQSPAKVLASGPELRYKVLGKTGLKVTSLSFGCMTTSDASVIERAADIGITYFDTARNYQSGNNERMVGAALKKKRKDVVLSTKTEGRTKEDALAQLDTSLKELGTDFVDIWYLHAKDKPEDVVAQLGGRYTSGDGAWRFSRSLGLLLGAGSGGDYGQGKPGSQEIAAGTGHGAFLQKLRISGSEWVQWHKVEPYATIYS